MVIKQPDDAYSDAEADQRRDEILRQLLRMPPKQQKAIKAKRAKRKVRRSSG